MDTEGEEERECHWELVCQREGFTHPNKKQASRKETRMSHGQFVPKWVTPPSGGWYHTPKNHHVNGVIAFAGFFAVLYGFYRQAERDTFNPKEAYSLETVAKWNNAAVEKK